MKILHIPNYYPPNVGGIEKVAQCTVRAIKEKLNAEQKVLCMNKGKKVTAIDQMDGAEIIRCASPIQIFSQSLSADFPRQLRNIIQNDKPDVVILQWPNPFTAFCLMRYAKYPFHFVLHWQSDIIKQKVLGKVLSRFVDRAANRADVIIATTPNYIEGSKTLQKYKDKVIVVPNCIDDTNLAVSKEAENLAKQIKFNNENKIICFAFGREVPYKGFEYLHQAESYFDKCVKLIHGKNLSHDELIAHLIACDIFCFPSITKNEAFGLALAEGMYFGHPAVTFTIPGSGVNYVSLNNVTGIECPNRDSIAYAKAVNELAHNVSLREQFGKQAKERVEKNFLYEQFKEAICNRWIIPDTTDDRYSEVCDKDYRGYR